MSAAPPGKIITFCSYRGGTGQSMTLANVAWILASNGKRVLAVDCNLDAPGLHRFFVPFLVDKTMASTDGLIDLFIDFIMEAMTPVLQNERPTSEWYRRCADIERYAASLKWEFPSGGTLDLVPAGRQGAAYPTRVSSINWTNFYDRFGGATFIEAVREVMRAQYDYVLVDSQSGVSEISDTCIMRLADALVVCYTMNVGSIDGAAALAGAAYEQRGDALPIFPVPLRVENAEKMLLGQVREHARQRFARYFPPDSRYGDDVRFDYVPFYTYMECLAVFAEPVGVGSILESAERLTSFLTDGQVRSLVPINRETAARVLELYHQQFADLLTAPAVALPAPLVSSPVAEPAPRAADPVGQREVRVFLSYSHRDKKYLNNDGYLLDYIRGLEDEGVTFWWDERIGVGDKWDDEIRDEIGESDIALLLVSEWFLRSQYIKNVEITEFLRKAEADGMVIFPIMLSPCDWESHDWLKSRKFLPGGGKTFKEHFNKADTRERFFLQVKVALRKQVQAKRGPGD